MFNKFDNQNIVEIDPKKAKHYKMLCEFAQAYIDEHSIKNVKGVLNAARTVDFAAKHALGESFRDGKV